MYAVRQVCEEYQLSNGEDVFWAIADLEKEYNKIDRHGMWQITMHIRDPPTPYTVYGVEVNNAVNFRIFFRICCRNQFPAEWKISK